MAELEISENLLIGLVDVDLLCGGTRHPNLALLKIAGFLHDNNIKFELIIDTNADISKYTKIYMSRVFTFSKMPTFYLKAEGTENEKKFECGGTGFYATESKVSDFSEKRKKDMTKLEEDDFFNSLPNKYEDENQPKGINMAKQMPYYDLYKYYIDEQVSLGKKRTYYKDYEHYSIGFLTRGCFRHCPFCVNKLEKQACNYSELKHFLSNEKDEATGKLKRPYIYLWDDNFLSSKDWERLLQELIDTKRPFQFRQGLDERILAQSPEGEKMAKMLSNAKYHGDFIFAFDNWKDREVIEQALKIWKRYNPKKGTKFYLFCGFKLTEYGHDKFYKDIWEIFQRIKILMSYGCVGYLMRHEDYHKYKISNLYVQIARWCNQQQFYKKMSFWEFCYRNQTYWEESQGILNGRPLLKTFEEFEQELEQGYYEKVKMCLPLKTILATLEQFPDKRVELLEMFNYKMQNLINPNLWE